MTNAQPEPSMEEILASIRRIISEDEEEQTSVDRAPLEALANAQENIKESVAEAVGDASEKPDAKADETALNRMLDIAEGKRQRPEEPAAEPEAVVNEEPATEATIELEVLAETPSIMQEASEDRAESELETKDVKMVKQAALQEEVEESIINEGTASAAAAAFGTLSRSVRVADDDGQTLETIVTALLRPMVKEWLDENLSRIVEMKVEDEVQRLSRRG